jgi:hypothetical protein
MRASRDIDGQDESLGRFLLSLLVIGLVISGFLSLCLYAAGVR